MKNIKKILSIIVLATLLSINLSITNAIDIPWNNITIINISWTGADLEIEAKTEDTITRWDILNFFANYYNWQVPESYKYIKINYKNVKSWSILEDSLKKLIYLNLIENPHKSLDKDGQLTAWWFFRLSEKILWIKIIDKETESELKNRNTSNQDIRAVRDFTWNTTIGIDTKTNNKDIKQKLAILNDVYTTIVSWHYDKDILDEWDIINWAIEWIAEWTGDKHTVYFPPLDSVSFQDWLSGDYEWIWSYVDMEKPGAVRIISPIPWSPSEKAWLKWWDLIIKVDWKEITEKNSLQEVITWIKWPENTKVILTVDREWEIFDVSVTRERIIITDIESEIISPSTYYIQIKSFWEHVSDDFEKSLKTLSETKNINKIIIDLRNNGWGYLTEVAEMLSYFVKAWETTAIVKYHDSENTFISRWYDLIDFNKYKIVILQNSWTASASEILIWTIKDYYPDTELVWENTYWKWSVQVMKNYQDWSLLKYTIAKWFTWLTETWIDWVWIKPTIELELDIENFQKNWIDNQLEKAKLIN